MLTRQRAARILAMALPLLATALLLALQPAAAQKSPHPPMEHPYPTYQPWRWNSTCKYRAFKVPMATFKKGSYKVSWSGSTYPLFPLMGDANFVEADKDQWRRCFGPGERYSNAAIIRGDKLPCMYTPSRDGATVDYWEEQACDVTHRSNCYCYSLNRPAPGYCSPGIKKRGRTFSDAELADCTELVASIRRDGGIPASRTTVYTRAPRGTHYIAAAIEPSSTLPPGDFHFWRLDGPRAPNGSLPGPPSWSYKAGYTFARNTYRDGAPIPDVEDPAARGSYTLFCGYFDVNTTTHTLGWVRNSVPTAIARAYDAWKAAGIDASLQAFPHWSSGWYNLFASTYVEPGWEDYPNAVRLPPRPLPSPARGSSHRSPPRKGAPGSPPLERSAARRERQDGGGPGHAPHRNNVECPPGGCKVGYLD